MRWVQLGVAWLAVGCGKEPAPVADPPVPTEARKLAAEGLHNVFRVSDRLFSGSSPEGEAGFASLHKLGVKTVVSVDGATPDVAVAEKHGLRYVHLPVGYDGIPRERALRLAKAVRDLPGPVYVHCHHGKHRGPAACAAIQLTLDPTFTAEAAERWMKDAGTDPKYTGLIGLPKGLVRPTAEELDRVPSDFPNTVAVPDLTKRMVAIDEVWDRLKLVKAAGWQPPKGHPDIDPPHEAVQLGEHYREAARSEDVTKRGPGFGKLLADGESSARELEQALRARPADAAKAAAAFTRSAAACATCHDRFRDRPGTGQ